MTTFIVIFDATNMKFLRVQKNTINMVYLLFILKKMFLKPITLHFLPVFCCFMYISSIGQNKEAIVKLHQEFQQVLFTDFNMAYKKAAMAVSYSEKISDKNLLLNSYKNLSEILYLKKENDSAYSYNKKAISLALELDNKKQFAQLYNLLGSIERGKNNYTQSLKYHEKALALADSISKEEIPKIKNNLARLYWATGEKQHATKILKEVIKQDKGIYNNDIADAYNILGSNFLNKNKDSSLVFYKKADSLIQSNYSPKKT